MDKSSEILRYIHENPLNGVDTAVDAQSSLFQGQTLDSLNMIDLISFLETTYGLKISPSEVTIENLDTVDKMVAFVDSKL